MTAAWDRWVAWVDREEPVIGLALFRIAIGLVTAGVLARIAASGAMRALWFPVDAGGIGLAHGDWRFALLGGPSPLAVGAVTAIGIAAGAGVALGVAGRVMALVAGQCVLALIHLVPLSGGGHDFLLTNALWLLALAPADRSLSLSCRWRTGRWVDDTPRAGIVRMLAIFQLGVVYTETGWQKLGPEWWPWGGYTAVYWSLLQPSFARADLAWIAHVFPLTQAMTAVTMLWECGFPLVLLWMALRGRWPALRRVDVRAVFLVVGLGVHGVLEATLNLGPFAWVTTAFYFCFFDADEYGRAWRWLSRRGGV